MSDTGSQKIKLKGVDTVTVRRRSGAAVPPQPEEPPVAYEPEVEPEPEPAPAAQTTYKQALKSIFKHIQAAQNFDDLGWRVDGDVRGLVRAERMLLFKRDPDRHELVTLVKMEPSGLEEIRLPINASSVPGYVAMAKQPLRIDNVRDADLLASIYPRLAFDDTFDQLYGTLTTAVAVAPITHEGDLIGVIQAINRVDNSAFSDQDVIHLLAIGQVIGKRFHAEMADEAGGPFDALVRKMMVSPQMLEKLQAKAAATGCSLTRLLNKEAAVPAGDIGESLAEYYQVPFLPYQEGLEPDQELLETLNIAYLARNLWVPFRGPAGELIIAIDNPNDSDRVMEIQYLLSSHTIEFRVGLPEDILHYLGFEIDDDVSEFSLEDLVDQLGGNQALEAVEEEEEQEDEDDLLSEDQPAIIQLVNRLIVDAVDLKASDIHVEPSKGGAPAKVRMRIDGECRPVLQIPSTHINAVLARIKILSKLDIAEKRLPQDGKMGVKMRGSPLELRVATLPTVNGESAVLRILAAGEPMRIDELNLSQWNKDQIVEMVERPHGIFLVVGPTGSGKTTTLHALLGYINTDERKIWTVEDPVEITQAGLQQVQTQAKIGLDFARALRAFLRADPDVILIGEMRDKETAHAGIEASLTGHLVFSTLHTNSAPETIVRLLDMGLDPMNFADALVGVLAQRLVRTLCKRCRQRYKPDQEELDRLVHLYGEEAFAKRQIDLTDVQLYKAAGCEVCNRTGYKGRTGIHELLRNSPEMKRLIAKASTVDDIRDLAIEQGLLTLQQDGLEKVLAGHTDIIQVRKVTVT